YKGNFMVIGRDSKTNNLFNTAFVTFEEDEVYNQKDAEGFIKLNALRFIIAGKNKREQDNKKK
ncbi:MAG: argininosuccinate synthase, partial [Campylobacteraceae bacterium]